MRPVAAIAPISQNVQTTKAFCGRAEVILFEVAEDEVAALQFALDDLDGGDESRILGGREIEFHEQEQARVGSLPPTAPT